MASTHSLSGFVFTAVFACLLSACGAPPEERAVGGGNIFEDPEIVALYAAADRRDAEALIPAARSDVAAYRRVFARLTGSVQDPILLDAVMPLMSDPIPYVRLEAAWAVGQFRDTLALEALEKAIRKATIPEVKSEVLEAIGKCAHQRAMAFLIRHEPNTAVEEAGKLRGIYHAAQRGLLLQDHLRVVTAHLRSNEDETRLTAALIAADARGFDLNPFAEKLREAALNDASAQVRHAAVRALAMTEAGDETFLKIAEDTDPAVAAAAFAALKNPREEPAKSRIVDALDDGRPWVAMAAAARFNEISDRALLQTARGRALGAEVPEVRAAAALYVLRLGEDRDEAWRLWSRAKSADPKAAPAMLRVLTYTDDGLDTLLRALKGAGIEATAAAEALTAGARFRRSWRMPFHGSAVRASASGGQGAVTVFAEAAAAPEFRLLFEGDSALFREAAERYALSGQFETRKALLTAYASLGGEGALPETPPVTVAADFEAAGALPRNLTAVIYTGGRAVEMRLLTEDAPASAVDFVRRVEDRYYDGLTFHRVVPGFVTQGGCPVGDGYHGGEHSLRSEFSPLSFGRGVVGLASAGKDTEGPQFFITHNTVPRLDGRYTVLGAVTEGLHFVSEIASGAVIDSVRVHRMPAEI